MTIVQRPSDVFAPTFTWTPVIVGTPGSSTPATVVDSEFNTITYSSSHYNYQFHDTTITGDGEITPSNETPSICSIANWPLVERVSTGTGKVLLTNDKASVRSALAFPAVSSNPKNEFVRFTAETPADILSEDVLSRLTEGTEAEFFTGYTGSTSTVTALNDDCWASGIELSGIGFKNGSLRGALVTKRHHLSAAHWYSSVTGATAAAIGLSIYYRRATTGEIISRQIVGRKAYGDSVIYTLSSDVPDDVTPLPVAGDWWERNKTASGGSASYYAGGIAMWVDQQWRCYYMPMGAAGMSLSSCFTGSINGRTYTNRIMRGICQSPENLTGYTPELLEGKTDFWKGAVVGDSGGPVFVLNGDQPILLGTWWYSTEFYASWGDHYLNDLIALADADAIARGLLVSPTGYTVTVASDPTI